MNDTATKIIEGVTTAFIDRSANSDPRYRPEFLYNDYKQGRKVLSSIEDELASCDSFCFSVAFITMGGLTPLLQTLKDLEKRGVPGRILTTDYLNFSEPAAIRKLSALENIEIKMYAVENTGCGFHTKGYIFRKEDQYRCIVGSANMTHDALLLNKEWNSKIVSTAEGEFARSMQSEFEKLWTSEHALDFESFIDNYETRHKIVKEQRRLASQKKLVQIEDFKLQPNSMQTEFVRNISGLIENGESKALLISATGTGKTYASAFCLREIDPARALCIVHREQIARQAMKSFDRVFQGTKTFGMVSGSSREFGADFVFCTMQMMAKQEVRERFARDTFDVIVIDEAHRTGAASYHRIMEYFTPKFWLGMTASPDRMDGFDVYELFNHNIACEIRLQQALEEDLLCPFHYFGITDIIFEEDEQSASPSAGSQASSASESGASGNFSGAADSETNLKDFNRLVSKERVDFVIRQMDYYGYSGDRAKGLIFCSSVEETKALSSEFNARGYRTIALSGADDQTAREQAVERLAKDSGDDILDYILTVDIFNEGVDVPEINQIIMLRPTESPIIFVQQLGRGLRKTDDKEYVVVLDFIGNYRNNFMIPIALSGDRTYNKDNIRRYVMEGERVVPGASTIHFDEIARRRIFETLDAANFSDVKLLKKSYVNLKNKLGRIPSLMDFDRYGEIDALRIFDNKNIGSYYTFLKKYEKDYDVVLTEEQEQVLKFVSQKLASGKRVHELALLRKVIENRDFSLGSLSDVLLRDYGVAADEEALFNVINVMTNAFPAASARKTFAACVFIESTTGKESELIDEYKVASEFRRMLEDPDFEAALTEVVDFGIMRYRRDYSDRYQDTDLVLYQKYTYEDACRLLKWEHNEVPLNIGGYKYDARTDTYPVFINYHKSDDIQDTIRYRDRFLAPDRLIAISKVGRTEKSEDVRKFLNAEELGIDVELFVRKNKDDAISKEFYYLGRMKATGNTEEFTMENTDKNAVEIEWKLDTPVREDLYQYIVGA